MINTVIKKVGQQTLDNYIIHLSDEFQDIRHHYEMGKLIIFDNISDMRDKYKGFIDNYVTSINTNDLRIKKAKGYDLLNPNFEQNHILGNFTHYAKDLQICISEITNWCFIQIMNQCFPGYNIESSNWTWRLTHTNADDMHLDTYAGQNNDLHNVRIFINLDDKPRIWRTSYALPEIYTKYYSVVQKYKNLHPNEINAYLNKEISWKDLPYHEIYFAPWSMWMCNSQWISHQGFYGNKMAAYTFRVDKMSMKFPNLVFEKNAKYLIKDWHTKNKENLNERRKLSNSGL